MELYIETLTGAAFELRVSPFETIMSVKAKIQRLEGKYSGTKKSDVTKETNDPTDMLVLGVIIYFLLLC